MRLRSFALAALLALGTTPALADTYTIDPNHTQVRFGYSHFGFSEIEGIISGASGSIVYDAADLSKSSVNVELDLNQVLTGTAKLDEHLKSPDFFDLAKYPTASFHSTKVSAAGAGKLTVEGELSIRNKKRPLTLDVTLGRIEKHPMSGKPALGASATATVKRTELGVGKYAPNVSDEVRLEITVEAQGKAG